MFKLLEKENVGTISLNDKVRISDPCYGPDTWCAGTLDNVLKGRYNCYSQSVNAGNWGIRIASIEVRHENYDDVEPIEVQDIDVGVDSGQAGIYDLDYFVQNREDDKWYWGVCDRTFVQTVNPDYVMFEESKWWEDKFKIIHEAEKISSLNDLEKVLALLKEYNDTKLSEKEKEYVNRTKDYGELYSEYNEAYNEYLHSKYSSELISKFAANTLDDKCLVSSSGDGDGSYTCLVGKNDKGQIVSIKVDYYYGYDEDNCEEDEYEE